MSKKSRFSTTQDSQLFKGSQTLLKSTRQQFDHLWSSLWETFSCRESFLVISQIVRPFLNTWSPDEKYFPGNKENLRQPIQMKLSEKLNISFQFFTAFVRSRFNFEHFEKKRSVSQLMSFRNCKLRKTCLCKYLESPFSTHQDSQYVKESQTLL